MAPGKYPEVCPSLPILYQSPASGAEAGGLGPRRWASWVGCPLLAGCLHLDPASGLVRVINECVCEGSNVGPEYRR